MICNKFVNYKLWKNVFFTVSTKNSKMLDIQVSYWNNQILSNANISFLGLKICNLLTWKDYIDVLIDKLNRSCFAIQSVKCRPLVLCTLLITSSTTVWLLTRNLFWTWVPSFPCFADIFPRLSILEIHCQKMVTVHSALYLQVIIFELRNLK
jgi:hypothetical protein